MTQDSAKDKVTADVMNGLLFVLTIFAIAFIAVACYFVVMRYINGADDSVQRARSIH